jgi:hypothetical protein
VTTPTAGWPTSCRTGEMGEIARLQSICRKTECGPLENEVVRLRAQITALENAERIADLGSSNHQRARGTDSVGRPLSAG